MRILKRLLPVALILALLITPLMPVQPVLAATGDISAVIDTLEFDAEMGRVPSTIHVSGDVYAIAYMGPDNDGWVCTVEILASGQIGATVIDTLEFDGVNALHPHIIHISGNIYAIAYRGPDNHGWVCTLEILSNGQIGAATIDTLEFDGAVAHNPTITLMSGNIYGIAYSDAYYGTGGDGWLCSVEILTDGQIGAAIIDSLEFAPVLGEQPFIIRVADTVCAIAVHGPDMDGWVYSVEILGNGQIGATPIDSLEFDPVEGFTCRLIHISGNIYAVVSSRSDDGLCRTFEILANGQIGDAVIDTLNYAPVMGTHFTPSITHVGAGIYAVFHRGGDYEGLIRTFKIENDGQIGDTVLDTSEFDPIASSAWGIHISGGICAIAYMGPDNDGWLCTVEIETAGADTPTVTTQAATSVEETTATGNGNITDTGNESCDERGVEWDTDSGAPYTYSATDTGSFGAGAFTKGITGLSPGTLYYYRAKAHNSAGWGYGSELTFLTKPNSPTTFVATPGDTQVSLSWVKGTGAETTIVRGKIDSYPANYDTDTDVYSGTGTNTIHSGLTNGQHWYYRAWSKTIDGALTQYSDSYAQGDATPAVGNPAVTTNTASGVTQALAVLNGTLDSLGTYTPVYVFFQYGKTPSYGTNTTEQTRTSTGSFDQEIGNLDSNTTYHFRAAVKFNSSYIYGANQTFQTSGVGPPALTTDAAVSITTTTATLQGTLTYLGDYSPVYVSFEYGLTTAYGTTTPDQTKTVTGGFNASISGLIPGRTYHFRARVRYNGNYAYGSDVSFATTALGVPSITTNDASGVSQTASTLHGTLTSLGDYPSVYVSFEYGTTTGYGSNTVDQIRSITGSFGAPISGLSADTLYHFRARVKYDGSYAYGTDNTFQTPATNTPVITTGTATNISDTSATLQGNLTSLGDYTPVYIYFQYGATTSYGITTSGQSKTATGTFSQGISGLSPSNTYHFRTVVKYNSDYIYGTDATFTTTEEAIPGEPGIDPPDVFRIDDIKVFTNYLETNDQLYVIAYRIVYTAGTPILDVTDYFDFQLLDGTILKGQWPVKSWDYKPGSIYLASASTPAWGGDYRIKIIGTPEKWETPPECYRDLTPGDWQGEDLTQLDNWVLSLAESLQNYYNTEMITYVTGGQSVLSAQGGVVFNMGIPGLSTVRPNLFSVQSGYADIELETDRGKAKEEALKASSEVRLGPYVSGKLEGISDLLPGDIGAREVAGVGLALIYLALALTIGAMAGNMLWGLSATILVFGPGVYFGVITPTMIGFIAFVSAVIFVYQVWWKHA